MYIRDLPTLDCLCTWWREMGIYACFRCPLHLTLEIHFTSVKGTSGDFGVTPQPNYSCCGCWDEDLREGTRAPCKAHPMLVRVFIGDLTSYQPGVLPLQASRANWACFPLCSLPYLWALPTYWLNMPTCDGQETTHRHEQTYRRGLVLLMTTDCEGKKRQLLQKWLGGLLYLPTYALFAATSYLSTIHSELLSNCLPLSHFSPEQNTEMFFRLVKYVFGFCKNSNTLGFFFVNHIFWKSPLHCLPCNPQLMNPMVLKLCFNCSGGLSF